MLSLQNSRAHTCNFNAYVGPQPELYMRQTAMEMMTHDCGHIIDQFPDQMPTFTLQEIRKA